MAAAAVCSACEHEVSIESYDVVPEPQSVRMGEGFYILDKNCVIVYADASGDSCTDASMARGKARVSSWMAI